MPVDTDLLDELAQEFTLPPLRPEDVTVGRLAKRLNITAHTAADKLEAKVRAGELVSVKCRNDNGNKVTAYRRKE